MQQNYFVMMRWLHWLIAFIILGMIGLGWYMSGLDKSVSYKDTLYFWHKSFGILVIFLMLARLLTRYVFKAPKLASSLPVWVRFSAYTSHFLLYFLMVFVPVTGYFMSNPYGISFFGLTKVPVIFTSSNEWTQLCSDLHPVMAYTLLGLIAVHVLAVIMHQFDKNPLHQSWKRMKL